MSNRALLLPFLLVAACQSTTSTSSSTTTGKEPPKPSGPMCEDKELVPTDIPISDSDCTNACTADQPKCSCKGSLTGAPGICKCACTGDGASDPKPDPKPSASECCELKIECITKPGGLCEKSPPRGYKCFGKSCNTGKSCCYKVEEKNPKTSQSWGDPHLRTLDGLGYDLQAVGEFLLVGDGAGFEIQVRQSPFAGSKTVSTNTAVAMRIGEDRVGIYPTQNPRLRVNGSPTTIAEGVLELPGGGVIYSEDNVNFDVRWPDETSLLVKTYADHLDLDLYMPAPPLGLRGLLGNADGDPSNDLSDRAGTQLAQPPVFSDLYGVFASAWRISQEESLFDYAEGEGTNTFTDLAFPSAPVSVSALSPAELEKATATCTAKGITDAWLRDACLLDVALTGDPGFADGSATATPPTGGIGALARWDFEAEVGSEWSNETIATTPGTATRPKTRFLGEFSADTVTLTLDDLPAHGSVTVVFDLYVIRSWDGNATSFGPDVWDLSVEGGPTLLHTTFNTFPSGTQAYPDAHPGGSHPGNEGAEVNMLGYTFQGPQDAIYRLRYTFPHDQSTLVLKFAGIGLQGASDESWGLDNVEVGVM